MFKNRDWRIKYWHPSILTLAGVMNIAWWNGSYFHLILGIVCLLLAGVIILFPNINQKKKAG